MILPPPQPGQTHLYQLFTDPSESYARDMHDAGAKRARLRTVLKQNSRDANSGGGTGDWTAAVKATTEYLPYLYAIIACVEADDLILKSDPIFTWRSSLSTPISLKKSRPKFALPSLYYELSSVLLTHSLSLSNRSSTLVASLGTYETSRTVSSADLKLHDETINSAAEMLCRASGVLSHLLEVVLPKWEASVGEGRGGGRSRPVELTSEVVGALAKLTLADANLLAIRRLLSRSLSLSHSTTTPGPPLSPSHPSPSLLSKLHLGVHTLYDASRSLTKSPLITTDLSPGLKRYLSDNRTISLALAYKWLGIDAGENGGREKAGIAIRWLEEAREGLEEVGGKSVGLKGLRNLGKGGKKVGKEGKGKLEEEGESVKAFLSAYKKVNDTLHFQPIPPASSLLLSVPSGITALSAKAFVPPTPAFAPRAHDGTRPKAIPPPPSMPALEGMRIEDDSSDDEEGGAGGGGEGEYFGAGSYW